MTTYKQKVKQIADEIYKGGVLQITIDLVQDVIEELINSEEDVTRDAVGAASYQCDILLEAFNPEFKTDIDLLKRLLEALENWSKDIEATNIILGIPKHK